MVDQSLPVIYAVRMKSDVDGTPGTWTNPITGHSWNSIELQWNDNKPGISCIPESPEGGYLVQLQSHPKHGYLGALIGKPGMAYEIMNVVNRDNILIHIANWAGQENQGEKSDLLGCVGLGKGLAKMIPPGLKVPQEEVTSSTIAIGEFYKEMGGNPFRLVINWL